MSEIVNAHLKKAAKGTAIVFLASGFGLLFWFFSKLIIVRILTKEEFGIYSLSLTIISIIVMIAAGGIPEGAARNISHVLGGGKHDEAAAISRSSVRLVFLSAVLFSLLLFFFADPVSRYIFYKPELSMPLRILSLSVPFTLFAQTFSGILRGHGILRPKIYADLGQPLFFLMALLILFYSGSSFRGLLYSYSFAAIFIFLIIAFYSYKEKGIVVFTKERGRQGTKLLKFSLPLLGASLISLLFFWTDTLMLGRYATSTEVGVYNIGVSLAQLMGFPYSALFFVFMPIGVEMFSKGQSAELSRTYKIITKWLFSATLPIFFILFFFPTMTISFLYGQGFTDAARPLRLLCASGMLYIVVGPGVLFLLILGMPRTIMFITGIGGVANLLLNYIFIKKMGYGMMGAAMGTLIANVSIAVLFSIAVYRRSRIHPISTTYVKPVLGSALVGLIVYSIVKGLNYFSFWLMPVYLILFLLGYMAVLLFTRSLEKEDVFLFESISQKSGLQLNFLRYFIQRFSK